MVIINIECAMKQEFLNYWNPDTIPTRNGRELGEIWVSEVGTNF